MTSRSVAEPELLTSAQVLSLLQIGRTKLWELVRRGDLPAYRIGSGRTAPLRYRRDEVLCWLDRQRVPQPEATSPSKPTADAPRE